MIDLGVGIASANAVLMATAGTNAFNFFVDGWFGMKPSTSTDNSWELSLSELTGMLVGGSGGMSTAQTAHWQKQGGMSAIVKHNMKTHGANSIATLVLAPVGGKLLKRVARSPIRQFNRLWKSSGLMQATGVKL